jgi:solute carrier family 45, member 1/2/4
MLGGALIVAFCLLLLGWASEVVGWFVHDIESVRHTLGKQTRRQDLTVGQKRTYTIAVAVLAIYGVDFAISAGE